MKGIELVIKVDENTYHRIISGFANEDDAVLFEDLFKNGVILPKGHGRLIDADKIALLSDLFCYTRYTGIDEAPYEDATKALEFAPTIIEADKAESEVNNE